MSAPQGTAQNPFATNRSLAGGAAMPPASSTAVGAPVRPSGATNASSQQWIAGAARPSFVNVANPPLQAGNVSYGPSYSMTYQPRSTADKAAVKYSGFLPLEGTYRDDDCKIG
ncbi:unnamed protein product [Amoebophrya sp. A25]|nr:unnamed protein product [Amoebophrya sp. A25]|eukprot:GSA25T00023124001.1